MFMFDFIQQACKAGYTLQGTATLDWGIWFHDVVHNPESSTNEADSAALAGQLLQAAGLQQDTINKIKTYILATASHHHVEGDPDGDLMMDADLAILGAPLHKYIDYAVAVRKEYGHLSDEEYTKSRWVTNIAKLAVHMPLVVPWQTSYGADRYCDPTLLDDCRLCS
eukprot:GHRR01024835.1.p1 GENE.GHRR01024835.1~~GHRR01024835.1.p1  ORF type:complete len:167 (+),score=33.89 GHRR01024835.1:744-1244(+)